MSGKQVATPDMGHRWVEVSKAVSGIFETQQDASHIQLLRDLKGFPPWALPRMCLGQNLWGWVALTHHTRTGLGISFCEWRAAESLEAQSII